VKAPARESRIPAVCSADVPLAPLTHCRIGGRARVLCVAESEEDVRGAVLYRRRAGLPDDEVFVLGGGANVLINDARDYGLVLKLGERFHAIEVNEDAGVARIQAGIYTPRLVREAARRGWEGFQFLAGVPGSLGGAVAMNAGVRELSTWDLVRAVEGITWGGDRIRVEREEVRPSYRRGNLPRDLVVTVVECEVRGGDADAIHSKARELASSRKDTQPLRWPSWGSTFKNPSGASSTGRTAGALIDSAGLKGYRVGDAAISDLHANFVVNLGAATAADALACIRAAYEAVRDRHGVLLEPEVRLIGFPPEDLAFLEVR
jgi:UDP-N-acetylmuramate dehydrogenase